MIFTAEKRPGRAPTFLCADGRIIAVFLNDEDAALFMQAMGAPLTVPEFPVEPTVPVAISDSTAVDDLLGI